MTTSNKMTSVIVLTVLFILSDQAWSVNLSANHLGQVLLVPYYNVEDGNQTFVSIANPTNRAKAVKITIREAENSRAVLGFNIYLSAQDVWIAAISDDGFGGAKILTSDTTCTVPTLPTYGVSFRSYGYQDDGGDTSIARTREGHIEFIELGVIESGSVEETALTHVEGVPSDCSVLNENWNSGGKWDLNPQASMETPNGDLSGVASIINVGAGVEYEVPITVLENFYLGAESLHSQPGGSLPNLSSATPQSAVLLKSASSSPVLSDQWQTGLQAVSAVLMATNIVNHYTVNPVVAFETDWVVTFPTKGLHTDPTPPIPPFNENFGALGACEMLAATHWDVEEASSASPLQELCYAVNIINFGDSNVLKGLRTRVAFDLAYTRGWAKLHFPQTMATPENYIYSGLPAVGFSVIKANNSNVGASAAYSKVIPHATQSEKDMARIYCEGNPRIVKNRTYTTEENVTCSSEISVTTEEIVKIEAGATVTYVAPSTLLKSGFSVDSGGNFSVKAHF